MGSCYGHRNIKSFEINDQIRYLNEEIEKLEKEKNKITVNNQNMYIFIY